MLTPWNLLIFFSYGIPMFTINMRTVYVLWRNRHGQFSSSYYRIFFLCGLNECILYTANNYALRFPSIPFFYDIYFRHFDEFSSWQAPIYFVRRYCSYFIHFINPLLAFNRLTAVSFYEKHEQLWQDYRPYWMAFTFIGAFIMSFQELRNKVKFATFTVGNTTAVQMVGNDYFNPIETTKASIPTIAIGTTLGIVSTILTFVCWKRRKTQIPSKYRNYELKLIWLTVVFYSICVLGLVYHAVRFIIFDPVQQHLSYMIVSDTFALVPSCAFLVASSALRAAVFPEPLRRLFTSTTVASSAAKMSIANVTQRMSVRSTRLTQMTAIVAPSDRPTTAVKRSEF